MEKFKDLSKNEEEKEREENEEDLKILQESDAAKGDLHSTDKSDIPLGVDEKEYVESFKASKQDDKSSQGSKGNKIVNPLSKYNKESERYYDTGIRPRVKLPPDEQDEWPLIIPNEPLKEEDKKEENKDEN